MAASAKNTALFLSSSFELSVLALTDTYAPIGAQTLVEVHYSAINPADLKHYHMGVSSHVTGYEWVGTALQSGPDSPFKAGQKLFGMSAAGSHRPMSAGAHQDYLLAETNWTWPLPEGMGELDAVGFFAAAGTSIDALFNCMGYGFPAAGVPGEDPNGKAVLIWGGGSALGQAGVQLAKAAGFGPVIATASTRNHALLKDLGADYCFDYNSATVEEDIRKTVKSHDKELANVWDTIGGGTSLGLSKEEYEALDHRQSTPATAKRCCTTSDESLKLVCALPVDNDPTWKFPLPFRYRTGETPAHEGFFKGFEAMFPEFEKREFGDRIETIRQWCLRDGGKNWKSMKTEVVNGTEAAIDAIKRVYRGEAGGVKMVIEHPFSV